MSLVDLTALTVLVVTSFVATNLDNLLLLVFLVGNSPNGRISVLLGYIISVILVIVVSGLGLALGTVINPSLVGYLGIAPLTMGCYLLYQQHKSGEAKAKNAMQNVTGKAPIWLVSIVLMFSNSADSIAVLLPLLAESGGTSIKVVIIAYLTCCLFWCALSVSIVSRPELADRISHHGGKLVPWIMMAVGIYVLMDTGTDTLLV